MKRSLLYIGMAAALCGACTDSDVKYDASGMFEATEVIVSAKDTGELTSFNIEEGQQVQSGAIIGCIDTIQLSLQKQQLASTISATESKRLNASQQVAAYRQQITNLQREHQRFIQLVKENAANQKQVDDIDYQIRVLECQITATSEQIGSNNRSLTGQKASIVAQIAQLSDQIGNSIVTSPIAGTVLVKYMEQGEFVAPGKPLFKVANVNDMKLRAYVTADQLTGLKIGQTATVYADQGKAERKAYEGQITWVSDKAEFTPKTIQTRDERANLVYAVKISVKNDGLIKEGMYGDVVFKRER